MDEKKESEEKSSKESLAELIDRMEKANAEHAELLRRQEELTARNLIGGQTDAGKQEVSAPEISPQDYAKKVLAGKIK